MDISPKVDIAFKKIFGVEENKDLLISLINSIVSEEDQVEDLTLLNPYNPQNFKDDKLSILDIKARGENGKLFNIEIQINNIDYYDKRALYYWSKLYTDQLQSGKKYGTLTKTIGIHILNFLSIAGSDKYHNVFRIKEKESNFEYFDDFELHTIELRKFADNSIKEDFNNIVIKIKNSLDRWVAFLARYDLLVENKLPENLDAPEINKALHVLEVINFSREERAIYEGQLKWMRDEAAVIEKAEIKAQARGIEIGREEGEARGIEKGKCEVAVSLLKQNIDLSIISSATNLSIAELKKLKDQTK